MSKVSVYVQCEDGLFYKNPVWWFGYPNWPDKGPRPVSSGESLDPKSMDELGWGWFFCFDDEDPPELVAKTMFHFGGDERPYTADEALELADRILTHHRVPHSSTTFNGVCGQRNFPQKMDGGFYEAWSFWVKVTGRMPVVEQMKSDGRATIDQIRNMYSIVYYEWKER